MSGAAGTPVLDARDVTVALGDRRIVEGVSFALRCNELTVLVGPNGAGKTTLLRAIVGLIAFFSPQVLASGHGALHRVRHGHAAVTPIGPVHGNRTRHPFALGDGIDQILGDRFGQAHDEPSLVNHKRVAVRQDLDRR